jgi:ribose 5-phosphate isomerase A
MNGEYMLGSVPALAERKCAAAEAAVDRIDDGMIVGIGTGSTAAFAIAALGRRVAGGLRIEGVATSMATDVAARSAGIPIVDLAQFDRIDLCIDGVDEIDEQFRAIKGAGGAMLREKIVASTADRMIAIADDTKRVDGLGRQPVPIEVLPMARAFVARQIERLGGKPVTRCDASGSPVLSDQGNIIVDAFFGIIHDPDKLARELSMIPGALGHGLFLVEVDELYLGTDSGVFKLVRDERKRRSDDSPPHP